MADSTMDLFDSIQTGDLSRVSAILEQEPDLVASRSKDGVTALMFALYCNEPEMADLLQTLGAPLTIFEAAALGLCDELESFLISQPEEVNAFSADGYQALGLACFFNQPKAVKMLLQYGAQVNAPSRNAMQVTPLHSAAAANSVEIVQMLLQRGADTNVRQQAGFTALHAAAQNGNLELVRLLLNAGADRTVQTDDGRLALDFARQTNKAELIHLLEN